MNLFKIIFDTIHICRTITILLGLFLLDKRTFFRFRFAKVNGPEIDRSWICFFPE